MRLDALEPRNVPAGIGLLATGNFVGAETAEPILEDAVLPADVTGASLTSPLPGEKKFAYDDILQNQSPTCVFASILSAVARTGYNLESGITPPANGSINGIYKVRVFTEFDPGGPFPSVWLPDIVDVPWDGTVTDTDLRLTDRGEFWPILYQRAFNYTNYTDFADATFALRRLTGQGDTDLTFKQSGKDREAAQAIIKALNEGRVVTAATGENPTRFMDGNPGIIHLHSYTVLGVELPTSGSKIFVTLRNPWGQDTDWMQFDLNNDGDLFDAGETTAFARGLDTHNDGIIRIPWAQFEKTFKYVRLGSLALGPTLNEPRLLDCEPKFVNPTGDITAYEGVQRKLTFKAVDPEGGQVYYSLRGYSPGTIDTFTGAYSFEPRLGQTGKFTVTVVAKTRADQSSTV